MRFMRNSAQRGWMTFLGRFMAARIGGAFEESESEAAASPRRGFSGKRSAPLGRLPVEAQGGASALHGHCAGQRRGD